MSDAETKAGAMNRARRAKALGGEFHVFAGVLGARLSLRSPGSPVRLLNEIAFASVVPPLALSPVPRARTLSLL